MRDKPVVAYMDTIAYKFVNNNILRTAGSLSYFLILSIFPFIIALLNILHFTGFADVGFLENFLHVFPPIVGDLLKDFLTEISYSSSSTILSISLLGGLWSASSGVKQVIRGINDSYHYKDGRNFFKLSLVSLIVTVGIIFLIILLVVTQIFGNQIIRFLQEFIPPNEELSLFIKYFRLLVPVAYMFLVLLMLYKIAPADGLKNDIPIRTMIPGTAFATIAIIFVSFMFNIYVSNFGNYSVTYGSVAGVIVFLIWLFLFSLMILVGGLINSTYQLKLTKGLNWPREESMIAQVLENI